LNNVSVINNKCPITTGTEALDSFIPTASAFPGDLVQPLDTPSYVDNVDTDCRLSEISIILNTISEIVVRYDSNMKVCWANNIALKAFGCSNDDIIGHKCYEFLSCKKVACQNCPIEKAIKTRRPQKSEVLTPDERILLAIGYPLFDDVGNIDGVLEIASDVTSLKQRQNDTRQQKDLIQAFLRNMKSLTKREKEVTELIAHGWLNKQIAIELGISIKTVEIHRSRIMNKLKVKSFAELVRLHTLHNHLQGAF
jgi:DNA-binding CsgD family transcriptional regulator